MSRFTSEASEAYDFFFFFERSVVEDIPQWDNAQRVAEPQEETHQKTRENVVELPQRELEKNRKPRIRPLRRAAAVLCFGAIFATVITVVYNQVQLTELTDQINTTTQQLEEAQSTEIQLNMEASQKMNGAAVEEYATNELGMSKVVSGQVTYVDVAQEDAGTVVRQATGDSFWEKLWSTVRSWFY